MPKKLLNSSSKKYSLVLDIGTTRIKAKAFDSGLKEVATVYRSLKKFKPKRGYVEQSPKEYLSKSREALREVVKKAGIKKQSLKAFGITNQRETFVLWDKASGKPVYPAVVWEDERTKRWCNRLKKRFDRQVRERTGLTIDPYFSASKVAWVLRNVKKAKEVLARDSLLFGTVDTWVLWNFCKGSPHLTDYTNASRTLIYNIKRLRWSEKLGEIFKIPREILPKVQRSRSGFGILKKDILGLPLKVTAVCGDQQASMFAVGYKKGDTKITYGTGTFIMQILGSRFKLVEPFFTTLVPGRLNPVYALEGKIDCCAKKIEPLIGRERKMNQLLRKLAFKVDKFLKRLPQKPKRIVIDGGVTRAKSLPEIQTSASSIPVERQKVYNGTALGVAKLIKHR